MATSVTPSAYTFFKNSSTGVSTVVGYESSSERGIRYTFTLPSSCTAGATSYAFSKSSVSALQGGSAARWNWAVSSDASAYLDTTAAGDGYATSVTGTFSGSATKTLYPGTTYYLFIYPGSTTYGWRYWNYPDSITLTVDGSITYAVSYNANGGSGGPSGQTKTYGTNLTLSSTIPTRTGYTFAGWNTNSAGTGTNYSAGGTYSANAAVTLYAKWTLNSYNLYFYPDGGTWGGNSSNQTISMEYGATKSMTIPTKTGHTFGGWAWTSYGTMNNSWANSVLSGSSTGISVYNNSDNGSVTHTYVSGSSDKGKYDDDHIKIQKSSTTASPGLGGFYRQVTPAYNSTYYHTFYAKLPTGYYFSYHMNTQPTGTTFRWLTSNRGTGAWRMYCYEIKTGSSGSTGTFGFVAANADSGSSTATVTWYLGANQITKAPSTAQTFTMTQSNTWMWPLWVPNGYSVTYNANGGSGSMSADSVWYGDGYKTKQNAFTRTGYTFTGWNEKADGTGTAWNKNTAGTYENGTAWTWTYTKNITLYAQWSINSYSLTLEKGTGISSVSGGGTKTYNSSVSINAVVKTGYTWSKWTEGSN